MLNKIKHITVNDKEYPLAFTLNVLESIQEKYGSIEKWGNAMQPEAYKDNKTGNFIKPEPCLKDVIWTLQEAINEGIDIENEDRTDKRAFLTHKQVGRIATEFGIGKIGTLIRGLAADSNSTGEEKNLMTTQKQN
jgi:hypothetical protein